MSMSVPAQLSYLHAVTAWHTRTGSHVGGSRTRTPLAAARLILDEATHFRRVETSSIFAGTSPLQKARLAHGLPSIKQHPRHDRSLRALSVVPPGLHPQHPGAEPCVSASSSITQAACTPRPALF
ncbi:hypothetical protein OH76DRAFT_885157 [Lentinus brumalis]|uniref:Uncharacterized protein n=1 Tax=Lentinus brumalis TaxID=2498619 RepID=A0A371D198_9APHY|nr:hypothetical protein OH76DRAFT_885157 [Polyporus brumalis]